MAQRFSVANSRFLPFGGLPSDVTTERSEYVTVYPTGGVSGPTIEFNISASQAGFVSLSQSYIASLLTIAHTAAGAAVSPYTDVTAPCEGFADAMWSNIQLYINGMDVSDATPGTYPYGAFYRNALTKSHDWVAGGLTRYAGAAPAVAEGAAVTAVAELAGRTLATPAGWGAEFQGYALYDKAIGRVAANASVAGQNWGAVTETPVDNPAHAFRQSKIAWAGDPAGAAAAPAANLSKGEFITTPQLGMWQNGSYLPANVDIRLVLTKAADNFCLMDSITAPASNIRWSSAGDCSVRLMLKRVYADSAMQEEFDRAILERPLRYNITRSRVAAFQVGSATAVDATNLLTGVRPDTVIVQFIPTAGVSGDYTYNPFASSSVVSYNTAHAATISGDAGDYCSSIYVVWGGQQVPLRPMTATSVNDTAEPYAAYLAAASGGVFGEKTPMISPAGMRGGRLFYTFQLNPDGARAGTQAMDLSNHGSLEVHATIVRGAGTETTTMMVIGYHAASVEVDANRIIRKEGM